MKEINLTEGSIFQKLIRFSLPMIAGNLLQQIYNLVDTLIVGKYLGANALAAVGSSYTLMVFITSIVIGLCMGSGAFFSADYGAEDETRLKEDIRLSFWFIFAVTIVIYLVIYPGMQVIQNMLQTPKNLMHLTKDYISVVFIGILFVFFYNFFSYLLRAIGNSVMPLIFLAVSSGLNIVLDIWFVVGLTFGVSGAAWATVIAQAVSGIGIMAYSIAKVPWLRWDRRERSTSPNGLAGGRVGRLNWRRLKEIIANDVATGIQQSVMDFGILMIQGLVNSFGESVMASFAAAVKIDTIAYMPAQEFGNAYSLFVSQNYGAKKQERIRTGTRISFVASILFCAVLSVVIFLFAGDFMRLFIDAGETQIIAGGVRYLRIEGAMYVGIGILFLWYGYFRGVNQPHISLILTIISLGTRVAVAYAFAPNPAFGVDAIWCAIPIGWFLADAAGCLFYRKTTCIADK